MFVNFIEDGFLITTVELDCIPDNEDRVVIFGDSYVVTDRIFHIGKNTHLNVYVECIGKKS